MPSDYDPVLVEVIRNELAAVSEEMAIATAKTARSPMVKVGDLTTALTDATGRLLGVGEGLGLFYFFPVAAGLVERTLAKYGDAIYPGDVFLVNDPYSGANHMPDHWLIAPQFFGGRLAAFATIYSHHMDIGGHYPGGQTGRCSDTYEEGVRIPIVKLVEAGKLNEALLEVLLANVRGGEDYRGDLDAKLSGCWRAGEGFRAVFEKYGLDNFNACFDHVNEYAERATREVIRTIPPGEYSAQSLLHDDGFGHASPDLIIKITLKVNGDRLTVDFAGTGRQARGAVNVPVENSRGIVYTAFRRLLAPDLPVNSGLMKPIEVIFPKGTLVNPEFPGAVGGRAMAMFVIEEVLYRAFAKALPGRIPVPYEMWDIFHFTTRQPDGSELAVMDPMSGGWGGRPESDGPDGIAAGSVSGIPAELLELDHTMVVEGMGLLPDSGGPGKHRGSLGVYRKIRYLKPGRLLIRTNKMTPTPGLEGGKPGVPSLNMLNQVELKGESYTHLDIKPGHVLYHRVNGAGGHGDPGQRDPREVLKDVKEERVTIHAALEQYGVVIDSQTLTVDEGGTTAARRKLKPVAAAPD